MSDRERRIMETVPEAAGKCWRAEFLKRCRDISDASWHEFDLLADVLGIAMVVNTLGADVPDGALAPSVFGAFYRAGSPITSAK